MQDLWHLSGFKSIEVSMEHRRFKRNTFHFTVNLIASDEQVYQAQVVDICPTGLRVLLKKPLPARIKVVKVKQSDSTTTYIPFRPRTMFVVHREGPAIGLCLLNEEDRIDLKHH